MKTAKKTIRRAGVRVSSTRPSAGSTAPSRRVSRKTQSERRPRTAYDLLALVCQHILDEPRRYYQEAWIVRHKASIKAAMGSVPSCGTMACRAGWIVGLHVLAHELAQTFHDHTRGRTGGSLVTTGSSAANSQLPRDTQSDRQP